MENNNDDWRRKIFGTQLHDFTMDNDFSDTSSTEDNTSEGDILALSNSFYDEELYTICATVERNIAQLNISRQQTDSDIIIKRELDCEDNNDYSKKAKCEEQSVCTNNTSDTTTNCVKTKVYDFNKLPKHVKQHITATETTYSKDVLTYKIISDDVFASVTSSDLIVNSISNTVLLIMTTITDQRDVFHVGFVVHVNLQQFNNKSFETVKSMFVQGDDLKTFLTHLLNTLSDKIGDIKSKFDNVRIQRIDMEVVTALQEATSDSWKMFIEGGVRKIV